MRFPSFRKSAPAVPPCWLIVGLGNPGPEYRNTRHNVGFRVIECLAERHRIDAGRGERRALVGRGSIRGTAVLLVRPVTFMNLSGEAVGPLMRHYSLSPAHVLVVHDDMDLPTGRVRVRPGGGAGGHNGLRSLIQHLGTEEFPRVKIGVGRPHSGAAGIDHVLGKFGRGEGEIISEAIERAADAVEVVLAEGLTAAMNRFNAAEPAATAPDGTGGGSQPSERG
jgi:PTH1 family peptidyl-tRNA hydrolase